MPYAPSPAGSRWLVLHAVARATAYRISTPASFLTILRLAKTSAEKVCPFPWFDRGHPQQARLERLAQEGPASVARSDAALRSLAPLYRHLAQIEVQGCEPDVRASLCALIEDGLVRVNGDGYSLTRLGIEPAVGVCHQFEEENVTNAWIKAVLDAPYLARLTSHMEQRCRRSAHFNEVPELVNNYIMNLLRRDGLRKRIIEGKYPTPSDMKAWTYKAALSQWRDEGRDALTRGLKGCRTEKDLRLVGENEGTHLDAVARSIPTDTQGVFMSTDDEGSMVDLVSGGPSSLPLLDVVGGNLDEEVLHNMTWTRGLALTEAALRKEKPGAADRFVRLFRMVCADASFREIGDTENVSRNRAATLVTEMRAAIQRASHTAELKIKVLAYVKEWPRVTVEDMEEPEEWVGAGQGRENVGGLGVKVHRALLDDLVKEGRLVRLQHGRYTITNMGVSAIYEDPNFGFNFNG